LREEGKSAVQNGRRFFLGKTCNISAAWHYELLGSLAFAHYDIASETEKSLQFFSRGQA